MESGTNDGTQLPDHVEAATAVNTAHHPFEFRGNSAEYFRIWVVNLALSLLTLGIFSAWAKVRRERYFYGNTWVAGAPFEYLASPINVLKGRLIAFALLIVYVGASQLSPYMQFVAVALVLIATPWIVVSTLRFRARYSAWSSVGFRFTGTVRQGFNYYLFAYVLLIPSFGLLYPYVRYRQRAFVLGGHRFGGHPFEFSGAPSDFYAAYVLGWFIGIVTAAFIGGLLVFLLTWPGIGNAAIIPYWSYAVVGVMYLAIFVGAVFIMSRVTNVGYNSTRFGSVGFHSTITARALLWIYASNTACILVSLGLLIPWAQIRLAHYRAQHIELVGVGDLESFRAELSPERFAGGAETASIFDLDVSL
jgi:uncharacterized membrane protein YjgN (DUF898 family)